MAKSFFLGTDSEIYTASGIFSAKISLSPESYGIDETRAAEYAVLNANYASAYELAKAPATRTRGKILDKNDARKALKRMASDLAKTIAGTPGVSNAQRIGLGLNVPAKRQPMPAPGKPDKFKLVLSQSGSLTISWVCDNPRGSKGTIYQVSRRIDGPGGQGPFEYVGSAGVKRFVDVTLPAGATNITYRVQAIRSTKVGPVAEYNVNIGGVPIPMQSDANLVRLAA